MVLERALFNVGLRVGKCLIFNSGAITGHDCSVVIFVHPAVGEIICGGVRIEHNSIFGAGAKVLQYKKIAGNYLIAAVSAVIKDIVREGIYFGVPALKFDINNSLKPLIKEREY